MDKNHTSRTATPQVTVVASPSLVGVFNDEQAQTLAREVFDLLVVGTLEGRVWIAENGEVQNDEGWIFDPDDAVAWADFAGGDPIMTVSL